MTLVLNWATPGPSDYAPHLRLIWSWRLCFNHGNHWDMDTVLPTGTDLILVTLVLTMASSVPGDTGSTWASPVTGDSDPKHGLT